MTNNQQRKCNKSNRTGIQKYPNNLISSIDNYLQIKTIKIKREEIKLQKSSFLLSWQKLLN